MVLAVLFAAGLGLFGLITATSTSTQLHSNPQDLPSVQRGTPPHKWADAVKQSQQIARAVMVEQSLPGLSVAVGVEDAALGQQIVWAEGFGWADLEKGVPVAPETRFRVGHASKALTSAAVGLLLEKGRLHLGDEIQTYVPEFPRKRWPVTLRQLMGHLAGIRHYDSEADYMPTAHCERASDGLRSFANDPLRFEPDTRYGYSTFGWVLVSAAVEAAAGEPFFTFMRTNIFDPLGMAETTSDSATESIPDRTAFYNDGFFRPALAPTIDYSCFAGGGGFLSTPSDLVRFGLAINSGKLLKPTTVSRLQSSQHLPSGQETHYGLGWMLDTESLAGEPARMAGHSSRTIVGGTTSFLTFPDDGIVVAVTANQTLKDTRSIAARIADAFAEGRGSETQGSKAQRAKD